MNIEEYRYYCLSLAGVTESFPFGEDTLVMKVKGKIFALASLQDFTFNVKCDPEKAVELREKYSEVLPGYHMNKKHWNTIIPNGSVSDALLRQWILDSYLLVVKGLPLKERSDLS
ncbi:MmcQ/YjbR family DNA-binding protein [Pararcticibacter amylolyticus]|uniref:MmcQ-like protein n=1 Tax=Pararcticibacter amylolyticus TaxID=2173175 RepID=A0A2U2PMG8_9SPHI|nr:MmcQ/YjbR family DNA-binding protein [Pararcticibacter amylolyticus]PWG82580.1 MmcQ-like protein [Pararcticibacter amylolyticus]